MRDFKKKGLRGQYGTEAMQEALLRLHGGASLKATSREFRIPRRTLRRHRDGEVESPGFIKLGRHSVLSEEHETLLVNHIQLMERALFGLNTIDVRKLAYSLAIDLNIKHPFNNESKIAGPDWLKLFLVRHQELSIRIPQATTLARATGFNRPQVDKFFTIFKKVLQDDFQVGISPDRIWNGDETGITNVQKPGKILATKGVRQVGKMTSAERGKTVTVMCAMSATGTYIPPFLIWPRQRMVATLMHGTPPGSTGIATPSGWMDSDTFLHWLEHFVKHAKPSKELPHILIVDGHHSHKTLQAIEYARDHGVIMITLPPHTTHKLQPLDRTFFKSLKSAYNRAADSWMSTNPGRRITFYEMGGIFGKAYVRCEFYCGIPHRFLFKLHGHWIMS